MYIELKNVYKIYGQGDAKTYALNNVNLKINKGEICVILGPSGSGKSTLLNVIGGLDKMDEGRLVVAGKDISNLNSKELTEYRRNNIGFVFQFYNLIPDLTAVENIEVVYEIAKNPISIHQVLNALEIEKYSNRFPKELSGGQQQRIAIARALVKNPELLLCDELTGALDSKSSREVLKFIQKVNKEYNTTVIIITHNTNIRKIANRVIEIKDGTIVSSIENIEAANAEEIEL